jgi:hypothetical protein
MIAPHNRVIVTKHISEESVLPGDVGTVVEECRNDQGTITGYELETLSVDGQTVAVCRVPADAVRDATVTDRLCSRASTDPTIDELHAVRHRISEQFEHIPKSLCEHYMKLQERHSDRLVRSTDHPPDKGSRHRFPVRFPVTVSPFPPHRFPHGSHD